jgi:GNAT superfamily N-acetyltransferase
MEAIVIRDATEADLGALCRVRDSIAGHEAKLREAVCGTTRFLVASSRGEIVGFASLFLANPTTGPAKSHIPKLSDCFVAAGDRSRGVGRALVEAREGIARSRGLRQLYVGVDPIENPRWFDFFRRRGYAALQAEPYRKRELWLANDGRTEERLAWRQDLLIDLEGAPRVACG